MVSGNCVVSMGIFVINKAIGTIKDHKGFLSHSAKHTPDPQSTLLTCLSLLPCCSSIGFQFPVAENYSQQTSLWHYHRIPRGRILQRYRLTISVCIACLHVPCTKSTTRKDKHCRRQLNALEFDWCKTASAYSYRLVLNAGHKVLPQTQITTTRNRLTIAKLQLA